MDIERIYKRKTANYLILCAIIVLVFSLVEQLTEYNIDRVAFIIPPILVIIFLYWWYNYGRKLQSHKAFLFFFFLWGALYVMPLGNIYWTLSTIASFLVLVIFVLSHATNTGEPQQPQ
jgi:hypothetical protein